MKTKSKIEMPDFKSEAEEGNWLANNQDYLLTLFKEAEASGTLTHGTVAKRYLTPTTTIRLDPADIALARQQAEARGLKYQTYLKSIIHQALKKEARKQA